MFAGSCDDRGKAEEDSPKEMETRPTKKRSARYQRAAGWSARRSHNCNVPRTGATLRLRLAVVLPSASPRWLAAATADAADASNPVYARAPQRRRTLRRLARRGAYEWCTRVLAPCVARLAWLVGVAVSRWCTEIVAIVM